jgi:hypothetical protein
LLETEQTYYVTCIDVVFIEDLLLQSIRSIRKLTSYDKDLTKSLVQEPTHPYVCLRGTTQDIDILLFIYGN